MLFILLVAYNLILILTITVTSFKTYNSGSNLVLPLLMVPLIYHFVLELFQWLTKTKKQKTILVLKKPNLKSLTTKQTALNGSIMPNSKNISDRDRRLFLKLIGSTGLSLFFMSLVSKEAQASFFGSMPGPGTVSLKDSSGTQIDPAEKHPTDGYNISQLDDTSDPDYAYYGFVDKDGNWYVQRETLTGGSLGSYRYFKGGINFSTNWTNRASLVYDDFQDIF